MKEKFSIVVKENRNYANKLVSSSYYVQNNYVRKSPKHYSICCGTVLVGENPEKTILFANDVLKAKQGLGQMPLKKVKNFCNPAAGDIEIPFDTPLCCDPSSETYHSM